MSESLPVTAHSANLSAAILTGGHSRRMGEPKAILRLEPDGPTMIERVAAVLRTIADDVFLVGYPAWPIPDSLAEIRIVEDARNSAADGLVAALESSRSALCLVVACDMPFLDTVFLAELVDIARRHDRSVLARDDAGGHPLHAVYKRADLPRIREVVASGERSLMRLCEEIDAVSVRVGNAEARRWSVVNINTPEDFDQAKERVRFLKEHPVHD